MALKYIKMKRILNIIIAAVTLVLTAACQKEETKNTIDPAIVGEWHLSIVEIDGKIQQQWPYDVYLTINSDCTFELYQKSGDQTRYTKFTGTCQSKGNVLSGIYASGAEWGDSWTTSIEDDTLTLTSSDEVEVNVYIRESLDMQDKIDAEISTKAGIGMAPIL
jgi:hypothetical protein